MGVECRNRKVEQLDIAIGWRHPDSLMQLRNLIAVNLMFWQFPVVEIEGDTQHKTSQCSVCQVGLERDFVWMRARPTGHLRQLERRPMVAGGGTNKGRGMAD